MKVIFSTLLGFFILYAAGWESSPPASLNTTTVIGVYHSKKVSRIGQTWANVFKNAAYLQGLELELKEDSTYTFDQCGNTETGTWKHTGDSIYLYCQKKGYSPSLGRELRCGTLPFVFFRQSDGSLYHEVYSSVSVPGYKDFALLITRMKKKK